MLFTHVLIPTDGSELSQRASATGIRFAKEMKARITGISVIPKFRVLAYEAALADDTKDHFLAESRVRAERHLAALKRAAEEEGVVCDMVVEASDQVDDAIVQTAEAKGCDLILMASRGRRGLQSLLLGSETQKVLTHTKIPVLICH
jgi:nucleotide-binding universal stress UspA family protein